MRADVCLVQDAEAFFIDMFEGSPYRPNSEAGHRFCCWFCTLQGRFAVVCQVNSKIFLLSSCSNLCSSQCICNLWIIMSKMHTFTFCSIEAKKPCVWPVLKVCQIILYRTKSVYLGLTPILLDFFQVIEIFGTIRMFICFWSSFWNFVPLFLVVRKKTSKSAYFIGYSTGNHHIKL